ncbi:GNAT family N-acetyltransferase [Flavobacteriales bacterium]|nr:GNAT family N-acetyltransferase [Flavobacteriales bacterium]MDC1370893.1 GNAT family N-acetyltransferase [Flavobacteriales bacterium]
MIVLTTDRLILREFKPSDGEAMFHLNSDEEVLRYTGDKQFDSVKDAKKFFDNYPDYEKNGFGRWAVVTKEDSEVIGWCGLKKHEDNKVDIGYRLFKNQWNNGFATEASIACLEYGFQVFELEEIVANAAEENKASIRVMEKIGMEFQQKMTCEGIENAVRYIKKNNLL